MFRRRWSGLPEDPEFPADLKKLGYFINEKDEIRSIANPRFYFDFFLNKNMRINDRQRFAFDLAVADIIQERLVVLGLNKLRLPLSTIPVESPHVPIFLSSKLQTKKRIVVIFGEREQDLGVIAHRVIGGAGGVDAGSMVSVIKILQAQGGEADGEKGESSLGIVLANPGENWWWPEGGRALSYRQSMGVKMRSAAHKGIFYNPEVNDIPCNTDVDAHIECVFETVLSNPEFVDGGATLEVLAVSDAAVAVQKYLDENWDRWAGRIGCLALLALGMGEDEFRNENFAKFLREKARMYIVCGETAGTPIANSNGNPDTITYTNYGCAVLSSGEPYYSELTLIKAKTHILQWMEEVRKAGRDYVHPAMKVTYKDEKYKPTNQWTHDDPACFLPPTGQKPRAHPNVPPRNSSGIHKVGVDDDDGLEVISREEWERRTGHEGNDEEVGPRKMVSE
ncbi:hypothetical protein M406DRAFT_44771 [Cryphonectria parasitica EP155]|uniref:Arb2 domain-containing protein n=1 Tax=Cryphonectria parasitica (strain ATCC 38755 / EP155) TaxID=660469 RepID=A0A9P4Y862_CRYP1|nr:uncharacterized protein M406DRAFT_44771 [Cryphonectria parasitica EP155]KAF3768526.1 hypothetical protein M406DRAFT_44771 [Cryphonectria parasitica EP155]